MGQRRRDSRGKKAKNFAITVTTATVLGGKMRFLNITVENFGVFNGKHFFELSPHFDRGQARHLTIVSGHNGAGKTTLFQAIGLALFGSAFLGDPVSTQQYNNFILSRMHRISDGTKLSDSSKVALTIQFVRSGQYFDIEVERQWQRNGRFLKETLVVLQDGQLPEIDQGDYQTWLDDFVSPGVGHICLFDAEQLDSLASAEQQSKILRETLDRLLGLDLVHRLQVDLEQLITRQGTTAKIDQLYTKVLERRAIVEEIEERLTQQRRELEEVNADVSSCASALAQQERLLAAEGGAYAAKRPLLQERLQVVKKEVDTLSGELRDMCADLLPFALAPELCLQLSKRLSAEIDIRRNKMFNTLWQEKIPQVEVLLRTDEIWEKIEVPPNVRERLTERLVEKLTSLNSSQSSEDTKIIHHLADPEQKQLKQWILQVLRTIPQQVQSLGERLRNLKTEQRRLEADLERAPDDAVLAPLHAEMARLQNILHEKQKKQTLLSTQIGSLQYQYNEKFRELQVVLEQYEKAHKVEKQQRLAERSRLVLRTYKDALVQQKLAALEEALTVCFNRICRKETLLSRVSIHPEDFSIHLEGTDGNTINLNNLSAGERQLYALALIWALRLVSSRPLPLAIDTPLARLDEMHRLRLVNDYIPKVSDQVLLFTTDAELDVNLLAQVEPYLARIYQLRHDANRGESIVTSESFFTVPTVVLEEEVNAYGV
jgi:DNA sulfur modification protein DndD